MTGLFSAGDIATLIATYGDVFAVIAKGLLLIGGLFIVKGGYQWLIGMVEKGIHFGSKK